MLPCGGKARHSCRARDEMVDAAGVTDDGARGALSGGGPGDQLAKFGDPAVCKGPLPGLRQALQAPARATLAGGRRAIGRRSRPWRLRGAPQTSGSSEQPRYAPQYSPNGGELRR